MFSVDWESWRGASSDCWTSRGSDRRAWHSLNHLAKEIARKPARENWPDKQLGPWIVYVPMEKYQYSCSHFEDVVYEQIKGTLGGSILSGFLAKALFQVLGNIVISNVRPNHLRWYVDYKFLIQLLKREHNHQCSQALQIRYGMGKEWDGWHFCACWLRGEVNLKPETKLRRSGATTDQMVNFHTN